MKHVVVAGSVLCLAVVCAAWAQDLPPGPGREIVQRACSNCHELQQVIAPRKTADQWAGTVDRMIANGAKLSDAEYDMVVDYLAAHFAPSGSQPAQPVSP